MKIKTNEQFREKIAPWYYGYAYHLDKEFASVWLPIPINRIVSYFRMIWFWLKYDKEYFKYTFERMRKEVISLEGQIESIRGKL